jgi:hypothetical protein
MTQHIQHIEAEGSRFNSFIVGTLMSTVIVLAGLLSFAPYSLM